MPDLFLLEGKVRVDTSQFDSAMRKADTDAGKLTQKLNQAGQSGRKFGSDIVSSSAQVDKLTGSASKLDAALVGLRSKLGGGSALASQLAAMGAQGSAAATGLAAYGSAATGALGVTAALGLGLGKLVLNTAKSAEEIQLMSRVTGLATDQLQIYEAAARVTGSSVSALTEGVLQYRQRGLEAAKGNVELTQTFQRLGLSVDEAVRNPSQSFSKFLDLIQSYPSAVQRVNAAQAIFGEVNQDFLRTIIALTDNQGKLRKQIEATGAVMSGKAISDLAAINREYESDTPGEAGGLIGSAVSKTAN